MQVALRRFDRNGRPRNTTTLFVGEFDIEIDTGIPGPSRTIEISCEGENKEYIVRLSKIEAETLKRKLNEANL